MARQQTTASRVRAILRTQFPPRWGPRYMAAQLSTRGQAPRSSKPSNSYSDKLQRRLDFISTGETGLGPLALMHPGLFELKTQVALCPKPQDHPLVGHPFARGLALPTTSGTAKAAERLGLLSQHPKTREKLKDGSSQWIPVPLVHDLLLFLKDEQGPYCLLWDVKRHRGDHGKPWQGDWVESTNPKAIRHAEALDAIFVEHMRELAIRIVRLARDGLDPMLAINLRRLYEVHSQPIHLAPQVHAEALEAFVEALKTGTPPNVVIDRFVQAGVDADQVKWVLDQAIWQRRIRIDLYSWWSTDQPLLPEVRDPLVETAEWFAR